MSNKTLRKYNENEGELIATLGEHNIRLCEGRLVCGNHIVAPEFWPLVHVPWDMFVTLRFYDTSLSGSSSDKKRSNFTRSFTRRLNRRAFSRNPYSPAGKTAFKYVRVNESGIADEKTHCHLLLHRDQRLSRNVSEEAFEYVQALSVDEFPGLESKDIQLVGDQVPLVSYFCKLEHNRTHKDFDCLPNFRRIIRKRFPCAPIQIGKHINLGCIESWV